MPNDCVSSQLTELPTLAPEPIEVDVGTLATLANNLNPFPVLRFDSQGKITAANSVAKNVFPIREHSYIVEVTSSFSVEDLCSCIRRNSIITRVSEVAKKWYQFVARGSDNQHFGLLYAVDISERIAVENELARSHAFLRKVIDTNPNLIFVKNSNGEFVLANKTVAELYGTTVDEIVGKTDTDFNPDADEVESFRQDDSRVLLNQRDILINEEKVTDADGKVRWLQTVKRPITFFNDETHVLGVSTDISKLRQLKSQLMHSQKMDALGQLAGGIAHDLNNILTAVLGSTALILEDESVSGDSKYLVSLVETAATQASQLTKKLLGFAKEGKHQHLPVDIHHTISELVQLLTRTMEENISIELDLYSERCVVLGDPVQIQQVLLNLAINARDAIIAAKPTNGILRIQTTCEYLQGNASTPSGNYVKILISDTGCGIDPDNIERIFEPFFTTKDPSKGTGMGLAMVYGIVENHAGTVSVESEPGRGSVFTVLLPRANGKQAQSLAGDPPQEKQQGYGTVLLVDDHPMIRDVTTQMLKKMGYEVITASDGIEALSIYKEKGEVIDLVIMDLVMPRLSAEACFAALRELDPAVRVILSTGYVNHESVNDLLSAGMAGFVQKPYQMHQLAQVVAKALEENSP